MYDSSTPSAMERAESIADEMGYSHKRVRYTIKEKLNIEVYDNDPYVVLEGKELQNLQVNEIAVSKEFALTLGDKPLGKIVRESDIDLIVTSIIEYPNYELSYQPLESLSNMNLFSESLKGMAISNLETFEILEKSKFDALWDELTEDEKPLFEHYFETGTLYFKNNIILKVTHDKYNYDNEREFVNKVSYRSSHDRDFEGNIDYIDSLAVLTRSNPLPMMLKATIANFVVSSIIVSSLYAFYIHLKNELNSKSRTLATLNLIGVQNKEVLKTYLKLFLGILITSSVIVLILVNIASLFTEIFTYNLKIFILSFMTSSIFLTLVVCIFLLNLRKIFKTAHKSMKSGTLTYVNTGKLTQKRIILNTALKRFTRTIGLALGFAFSVALSITVVLVSLSSLTSVTNIFHEKTLGLHFDYILENPDINTYIELEKTDMDIAQVIKDNDVMFLDYSINVPIDNITKGSIITIHDEIRPFTTIDLGDYPPHVSEFYGEDGGYNRKEVLASKRLMDYNKLHVFDDPKGAVDKHYLFTKGHISSFEEGISIKGSFNSLMDHGFVSYVYQRLPLNTLIKENISYPSIVNLNGVMAPDEFETLMDDKDISYVKYDQILKEFTSVNNRLNQDTLEILLLIVFVMTLQAIVNTSGVLVNVRQYRLEEDNFYQRMGIQSSILKRVNMIDIFIRFLISFALVGIFTLILLPLLNHSLKQTFAVNYLPTSLQGEIIVLSLVLVILLVVLIYTVSKYRGEKYVKN